jgi:hypothetical protein
MDDDTAKRAVRTDDGSRSGFPTAARSTAALFVVILIAAAASAQSPVAVDDAYTARSGDLLLVEAPGVLENDHDGGGEPPPPPTAVAQLASNVSHGVLVLNGDGSFDYSSNTGFIGLDTFTYYFTDGALTSNTATVTISVEGCEAGIAPTRWLCWVEQAYLAKVAELGLSTFVEGAEDDIVWAAARHPDTTPDVTSQGVTWTSNFPVNDIATGPGPARNGDWGLYSLPHGDQSGPIGTFIRDGFVATGPGPDSLLGVGGWLVASQLGSRIEFVVGYDGGSTLTLNFPDELLDVVHKFYGFIDTAGFTSIEMVETEGTVGQPLLIFGDDFSILISGSDTTPPQVVEIGSWEETADGIISEGEVTDLAISELVVRISETVQDPPGDTGADDVTNPANYLLFEDGGDGFQTLDCAGGIAPADTPVAVAVAEYLSGEPSQTTLTVNNGVALPIGVYRLLVCGTTSLVDWASNPLDGDGDGTGADDFVRNFEITAPVNDPPVADDQAVSTLEDLALGITLTGSDPDGDTITFAIGTGPSHGALSGTPPNVTYTPTANYNGPDSFTFTTDDGPLTSDPATISITVNPVNDPPTADDQSVSTPEDTALPIILTGDDVDGDTITFAIATGPAHGALTGTPPNVTYTPNADYNGPDGFTFTTNDGPLTSVAATVSITVTPVNDPPLAVDDGATTDEDTAISVSVLSNDDLGDEPTTITGVTQGSNGSVAIDPGATSVSYTPNTDYHGPDSFTYTITDADLETSTASVSVTVDPVNDPPTADDQSVSTPEDTALPITLTGDDVDGDTITFAIATGPAHGVLSGTPPNVTYTPNTDYNGPDSFTFTASDATLTSPPATVSIAVSPTADPVLTIDDGSVSEPDSGTAGTTVTIHVSEPSPLDITVDFATADGSALAGVDYVAASGTRTIPAMATSHDLTLNVVGDLVDEPDETFAVILSNPVGAALGSPATAAVTIFDNDPMPEISAADVIVGEAAGTASISIGLSDPSGFVVSVDYATADGTASAPGDYGAASGTASIVPGSVSTEIAVPIVDDGELEPDEDFSIELTSPSNAILATPSTMVTIIDNDGCNAAGDANGDCLVDASDLALVITIVNDPSIPVRGNPDCDGSGIVDGADLVCVAQLIVSQ